MEPEIIVISFCYESTQLVSFVSDACKIQDYFTSQYGSRNIKLYLDRKPVSQIDIVTPTAIISTAQDVLNIIASIKSNRAIIYISCHGESYGLEMPDGSYLTSLQIWEKLVTLPETLEAIFFLDCCYPSNFHLAYKLQKRLFRLTEQPKFLASTIYLVTSADKNQKSVSSSISGSYFTNFLITELSQPRMDLFKINLSRKISSKNSGWQQDVSIFCSQPIVPIFPSWLCPSNFSLDYEHKAIKVNEKPLSLTSE